MSAPNTYTTSAGSGPAPGTTVPASTTTTPATTTTSTSSNTAAHDASSGLKSVKGVLAAVHGAGETLRGTVNSAVDETFHDTQGKVKNDRVTAEGIDEIESGKFGIGTKNREGAFPGADHEVRKI